MAREVEYVCDSCGFSFKAMDKIFWIDDDLEVHVEPLLKSTSALSSEAPVKGFFAEYYCYSCRKFIDKYVIYKKSPDELDDAKIIELIEGHNDAAKVIQFDDYFQKCLQCGSELPSRAEYSFVLDGDDEFHIGEDIHDFSSGDEYKFTGEYHGYFCSHCKKQINKFVITENNSNMTDSEIRDVLSEHTNDLTIFLRRDYNICPDCGEEIYYLHEDSTCIYCREGKFTIESENVFD